jgi:two-component system, chemotaxis family, chemotaxis protein CheY
MKRTILLVEDTPMFQYVIAYQLRGAGFHVICAEHGKAALEALDAIKPLLVLLDLSMPVMDGITFLRHFRQIDDHHETPVILLSASSETKLLDEARELGVKMSLVKSRFSLKELLAAVNKAIGPDHALLQVDSGPSDILVATKDHP